MRTAAGHPYSRSRHCRQLLVDTTKKELKHLPRPFADVVTDKGHLRVSLFNRDERLLEWHSSWWYKQSEL